MVGYSPHMSPWPLHKLSAKIGTRWNSNQSVRHFLGASWTNGLHPKGSVLSGLQLGVLRERLFRYVSHDVS